MGGRWFLPTVINESHVPVLSVGSSPLDTWGVVRPSSACVGSLSVGVASVGGNTVAVLSSTVSGSRVGGSEETWGSSRSKEVDPYPLVLSGTEVVPGSSRPMSVNSSFGRTWPMISTVTRKESYVVTLVDTHWRKIFSWFNIQTHCFSPSLGSSVGYDVRSSSGVKSSSANKVHISKCSYLTHPLNDHLYCRFIWSLELSHHSDSDCPDGNVTTCLPPESAVTRMRDYLHPQNYPRPTPELKTTKKMFCQRFLAWFCSFLSCDWACARNPPTHSWQHCFLLFLLAGDTTCSWPVLVRLGPQSEPQPQSRSVVVERKQRPAFLLSNTLLNWSGAAHKIHWNNLNCISLRV